MCKHNTQVNEGLQITAEHGHGEHRVEVLEAAMNVIRPQIHMEWVERPGQQTGQMSRHRK